jgi:hypothetical protein
MGNLKLDELICMTAWKVAFIDAKISSETNATEKKKNLVRAMRAFFKMDGDRFNNANEKSRTSQTAFLSQLEDKDPITKILSYYAGLRVAYAENEDGADKSNLSDKEWQFMIDVKAASKLTKEITDDISATAYDLVYQISAPENLEDEDLLELIEMEKEAGVIFEGSVQPLLEAFFTSLEKNNLFDTWEENYLALIKYKSELQAMFGVMDFKEFDTRYKELKPIISNFKKNKIDREKQIAKENEAKQKQLEKDKADREKQLAKENEAKQKQLEKDKAEEEKNKTHEYSVSNGIDYCRYCGLDKGWSFRDCIRQNGHQYSVKRVLKSEYKGTRGGFEYKPICKKCGQDSGYNFRDC